MREFRIPHQALFALVVAACIFSSNGYAAKDDAKLPARVAKLERALESRGLIDLLQQLETLQREVQTLRGQLEEQTYTIEQLRKGQRDSYVEIDQRLQGIEASAIGGTGGIAVVPPLTTVSPGDAHSIAGTPAPQARLQSDVSEPADSIDTSEIVIEEPGVGSADAPRDREVVMQPRVRISDREASVDDDGSETAYSDAFNLLKAGRYDESIAAFSEFLQSYPQSQYADNAQYWLGETYYVQREYALAVTEYQRLLDGYPTSKKLSHAMLKIGYSQHELGNLEQARAVLEDVRGRYPGTTAARLAKERIDRILAENPS